MSIKTKGTKKEEREQLVLHHAFPVFMFTRRIRSSKVADRVGKTAPVFKAAVLEYLIAELIELAGNAAKDSERKSITPRHLMMAIQGDDDLNNISTDAVIPGTGVLPQIRIVLEGMDSFSIESRAVVCPIAQCPPLPSSVTVGQA